LYERSKFNLFKDHLTQLQMKNYLSDDFSRFQRDNVDYEKDYDYDDDSITYYE